MFWIGGFAGSLLAIARVFICVAIVEGIAGPVQALVATHAVYHAVFSTVFDGQSFTTLQAAGLLFALIGVFVLSFVNFMVQKVILKKKV